MSRRERIKLPRYLRPRRLAGGATGYFWELPPLARPKKVGRGAGAKLVPAERHGRPCPVESQAFGTDLADAITRADRLNAALDEWRVGVELKPVEGTVDAIFAWYRGRDRFAELSAKVRKDYRRSMDALAAVQLKTTTFGKMRVTAVRSEHADALYRHLQGALGKRPSAYCMQVARRVWYEWGRDTKAPNPFARMNLKMKAEKGNRATSRAEFDLFREKARAMGVQPMATAAALSFELIRRVSDVFGYLDGDEGPGELLPGIYWEDYRPGDTITLRQHKTGKGQLIPLVGEEGEALYPALEEELARTPRGRPDAELGGQPMTLIVQRPDGRRYTQNTARDEFNRIRDAAGLPKSMTPTGFRHGGATELGDALIAMGVDDPDLRPITGHATKEMTDIYNKVTVSKARALAKARRAHVEKVG